MSIKTSNVVAFVDNTRARRLTNRETAEMLSGAGAYVFQTSGKTPITPRFNKADDSLTVAEVEEAVEEYEEKHKYRPVQVGATRDPKKIKNMARRNHDAMWSISCGPSKIVVIDADQKDGGPEKIGAYFEEHGLPEGCVVVPTQSGGRHYYFSDPTGRFTNAAGLLKRDYGCDVRGRGGQCVAPGSIREDGKTYGTKKHLIALRDAIRDGTLPTLPDHVAELIGSGGEAAQTVDNTELGKVIKELEEPHWPSFEEVFDPTIGEFDLEALKAANPALADLWDNPTSDCSDNRWKLDGHVFKAFSLSAVHLAVLYEEWKGAGARTDDGKGSGNYNLRDIAREWIKNRDRFKSKGEALTGALDMFDDAAEAAYDKLIAERRKAEREGRAVAEHENAGQAKRFVYIENMRGAVLRMLDWCIKFFVARGTTSVATGMWGAGKTAVFSDIGLHVGHGFEWRGRKVKKGVVIYVALENSEDVERRVAAWCDLMERAGRDLSGGAFVVHRGPCRLYDPSGKPTKDEKDLIEIAKTAAAHYGLPVAMIVIDTLAQSIMPGNDNDAKDAGIYTAAMQRIVAATGANVTALAHPTKSGEGVRGSGALQANVDTVIEVSRDSAGRGTIKAGSKFRIGNPAKVTFGYRLRSQAIGKDEDGDDISVVLAEDQPTPNIAVDDTDDDGVPAPTDTPADKLAATLRVFRERAESIAANTGEAVEKIGLKAAELLAALNTYRRSAGLPELKDRTIIPRLLGRLVEAGEIVKSGDNRGTEYNLAG